MYALMARCLMGEATPEDELQLMDLLAANPLIKTEYEHFRLVFPEPCNGMPINGTSPTDHLQRKLEQLSKRFKEEEAG
jgi:hypothetical protein